MSNVASQESAPAGRPAVGQVSPRAQRLADRLTQGANALAQFASRLSDAEWQTRLANDGRKIGVVIHHVASVYPVEIHLARVLAQGKPITGVLSENIDQMNAVHAREHDGATREATVALLLANSAAAAEAIRVMSDAELDCAATVSLYGGATLTCQFVLEDHAVRHSSHHFAKIRAALTR